MFLKCFICYGKYSDSATEEELVDAFSEAGTVTDFRFFLWVFVELLLQTCILDSTYMYDSLQKS